ncbi:MAG: sulfotransferase family 2 domain-containing protein [Coleofasciculus sp. D1-CHI-01]|uniref:hypothetical protein n=1 Tax=Coleofasciculus sp. D1-CHI-01 TaxID=3068482 RepID=UPI003302CB44
MNIFNDNKLIVFTHIPKTAGTFLLNKVIAHSLPSECCLRCAGFKSFIFTNKYKYYFFSGHIPYGFHHFTNKPIQYITFLRDPLERAVSYYYSIKEVDINMYKHPFRDYVDSLTLKQFYENRRFQNIQTRFIAGYFSEKLYSIRHTKSLDDFILKKAKSHLINHYIWGIVEKLPESLELFHKRFDWKQTVDTVAYRKTKDRPKVSDLDGETLQTLRRTHMLDLHLYDFALHRFDDQ